MCARWQSEATRRASSRVILALLTLVLAAAAEAGAEPGQINPKSALVLAERVVQHDAHWKPTSVYCEPPRSSRYPSPANPGATQKTARCEWVKQGGARPWEIDTIRTIYGPSGKYLFSLVSSTYPTAVATAASCRVSPAPGGVRTTCDKA